MLTQKEVYNIMKKDFLELQRKRIEELESMVMELLCDYQCVAACADIAGFSIDDYARLSEKAEKMVKKGISL